VVKRRSFLGLLGAIIVAPAVPLIAPRPRLVFHPNAFSLVMASIPDGPVPIDLSKQFHVDFDWTSVNREFDYPPLHNRRPVDA
jgi:hypothetical protein